MHDFKPLFLVPTCRPEPFAHTASEISYAGHKVFACINNSDLSDYVDSCNESVEVFSGSLYYRDPRLAHHASLRFLFLRAKVVGVPVVLFNDDHTFPPGWEKELEKYYRICLNISDNFLLYLAKDSRGELLEEGVIRSLRAYGMFICPPKTAKNLHKCLTNKLVGRAASDLRRTIRNSVLKEGGDMFSVPKDLFGDQKGVESLLKFPKAWAQQIQHKREDGQTYYKKYEEYKK
jgi:hypothetical protein